MAKPTALPEWDTTQVNSIAPDAAHKAEGWLAPGGVPEKPPFQTFNYWQNEVYRWIAYFDLVLAPVDSIADLRGITYTPEDGQVVGVLGYYAKTENRDWLFQWNNTSTTADNNGTVIKVTAIATGRWIRVYSGAVNATWFGVTADGVTDDAAAAQACINFSKWIEWPQGQMSIGTGLIISGENVVWKGVGKQRTQFVATSAVTGDIISWNVGTDTRYARGSMRGFSIRGARSGSGNWEDYTYTAQRGLHIENIINGLKIDDINVEWTNDAGIRLAGCFSASLGDCFVEICNGDAYDIDASVGGSASGCHNISMDACRGYQVRQSIKMSSSFAASVNACGAEDCLENGFNFADCRGLSVDGCWLEDMDLRATGTAYAGIIWQGCYGIINGTFFNGVDSVCVSVVGVESKLVISGCHDNGLVTTAINNPDGAEIWDIGNKWSVPNSGLTYNEEGTWTPSLVGSGTPGANTYLAQEGTYKRDGNKISFTGYLRLNAKDAAMTGSVSISGLPYNSRATLTEQAVNFSRWGYISLDAGAGAYTLSGLILPNTNGILLVELPTTIVTDAVAIDSSDVANSNNVILTFSGEYFI